MYIAAHCFQAKGQPQAEEAEDVVALLGKHNLSDFDEIGSKNYSVNKIILHDKWEWNETKEEKYDSDIALIVLSEKVQFTDKIRLVRLPEKSFHYLSGEGIAIGWGQSDFNERHSITPNLLKLPVIDGWRCLVTFPKLAIFASLTSFCGGYKNQAKAMCNGDSGGGFYKDESGLWYILGIVSASVSDHNKNCVINSYQIYTQVSHFVERIEEILNKTTSKAARLLNKMEANKLLGLKTTVNSEKLNDPDCSCTAGHSFKFKCCTCWCANNGNDDHEK
jgi:hypothetical protein